MELKTAMMISASGLKAQSSRMRVVSENIANSSSTALTPGGDPYRRKTISFDAELDRNLQAHVAEVRRIGRDMSQFPMEYNPNHPAADDKGYVKLPNVNALIETMDMKQAQRSYEANLEVMRASRTLAMRTIGLLRQIA